MAAAVVFVATVTSTLLRLTAPPWVVLYNVDDDQLYIRLANSLQHSNWLGVFDSRTLEKPPGFSFFVRLAHLVPVPFMMAQHLLLLAAAGLMAFAVHRATRRLAPAVLVYVVLVLDPTYSGAAASRLLRDNWYSSLSLLLLALGLLLLPRPDDDRPVTRRTYALFATGGALAGGCLFLYWLGRSERPWLIPSLAAAVLASIVLRVTKHRRSSSEEQGVRPWLRAAALPALSCAAAALVLWVGLTVVASKNDSAYGVRVTEDMYSGPFADLYGTWQSVQAGPARRFVPISKPQREAVYEVSAAARRLAPSLEDPDNIYIGFGCQVSTICDDFMAGWLPFALREATVRADAFTSAPQAHALWTEVADDIRAACSDGRLRCSRAMPATLPSPSRISLGAWWRSTWTAADYLVRMGQADGVRPPSGQPEIPDQLEQYTMFRSTLRGLPATIEQLNRDEAAAATSWPSRHRWITAYSWLLRLGLPLAMVGLVVAAIRRPPGWCRVWIIGTAALIAAAARVVTVGFVDSTTFPAATSPSYMLPASSPALLATVIGLWLLVESVRPGRPADTAAEEPPASPVDAVAGP